MAKNDGGPAFPMSRTKKVHRGDGVMIDESEWNDGMSLRDAFAMHALGGCEVTVRDDMEINYFEPPHKIAKRCYEIADAMLKERGQSK